MSIQFCLGIEVWKLKHWELVCLCISGVLVVPWKESRLVLALIGERFLFSCATGMLIIFYISTQPFSFSFSLFWLCSIYLFCLCFPPSSTRNFFVHHFCCFSHHASIFVLPLCAACCVTSKKCDLRNTPPTRLPQSNDPPQGELKKLLAIKKQMLSAVQFMCCPLSVVPSFVLTTSNVNGRTTLKMIACWTTLKTHAWQAQTWKKRHGNCSDHIESAMWTVFDF